MINPQDINWEELENKWQTMIGIKEYYDSEIFKQFLADKLNRIEKEIDKYILEGIEISKQNHRNNEGLRKAKQIIRKEFIKT